MLPAARAGAILNAASAWGKFQGTMAATTPSGSRRTIVEPTMLGLSALQR